jgi:ribonuclease P protein component
VSKKFTLGKQERLKSRKSIEALFGNGRSFNVNPLRIICNITAEKELQMAAGASTKLFKRSVDRNRIKRLIKEAYRLSRQSLKESLFSNQKGMHLFISYTGKELPDYQTIESAVKKAISKLENMINENSASHT